MVTSHLSGLPYRTTNLFKYGLKLVFVFDGVPPDFKVATIEKRKARRDTAEQEWMEALAAGRGDAFKYAQSHVPAASRYEGVQRAPGVGTGSTEKAELKAFCIGKAYVI